MKEFELQKKYNWELANQPIIASNHYLGEEYLGGIIFNLYTGSDGQQHGHVISIAEITDAWSNTTSTTGANRSWDSEYNMNLMIDSPVKTWIQSLGTGWYLPSSDLCRLISINKYYINQTLFNIGETNFIGNGDDLNPSYYWTSLEYNFERAWGYEMDREFLGSNFFKDNNTLVKARAVKSF